ncbi:MAG: RsmB/NOP family class I SAM-dependent RNA methyltransferase, partial [Pseudomonadota bacterium]
RRWRSTAVRGGAETGRARVLGVLRERGEDPDATFTGGRYAMSALSEAERLAGREPAGNEALDIPDWLAPDLRASLGAEFEPVCRAFRARADVFLRWNAARTTGPDAIDLLARDGITVEAHPLAPWALRVVTGARRIRDAVAYQTGLVEIQDAASQAVCAALPITPGMRVLDYCAGGGGKALALAALGAEVVAHDANPARMTDLAARAARAQCEIVLSPTSALQTHGTFDLVLTDVPCSGSGAWRRQAQAKWTLTLDRIASLQRTQAEILDAVGDHLSPSGRLAYVTCSLLDAENEGAIERFLLRQDAVWDVERKATISPLAGGDGFFLALLRREVQP